MVVVIIEFEVSVIEVVCLIDGVKDEVDCVDVEVK